MANNNFFVDGGTVQAQEGAIYLRRAADDQLLSLCRTKTFAYVLTARQLGKSSLMVNTEERLATEGIRTVEIDLTRIGVSKVTRDEWYCGILFEVQSQLSLKQDVIEWWNSPLRQKLSTAQRLLLFFEQVMLVEISEPIIIFVDEIETTLRLDFTDDFFAAIRSVHNARSSRRFERLAFVLIGAATPDSLIRDQQLTPFNIGQSVVLSDFTFEDALPFVAGFGLPQEDGQRILRRVLNWSSGHPYLTQRLCRAIVEERRTMWTDADVDSVVERVFFNDQSDVDKNLRFVREMLLKSELDQESVLATYRDILREGRPVLDEEQALVKSHLKLSGVVKRKGMALCVRNPIYRAVFNEAWVKSNMPVNWTRRLTRVAAAVFLAVLLVSTILAPYAWRQKIKAEKALQSEKILRQELQQEEKKLQAANQNLTAAKETADAAKEAAEKQSGKAQIAAHQEKVAKERAEVQGALALKESDRARLSENARARNSFIGKLIATDQSLRGTNSQSDRVIVAREAFLQSRETEARTVHALGDSPLSPLAYQNLMESAALLPHSRVIPFTGDKIRGVYFTDDGRTLVGVSENNPALQMWDFGSQQLSSKGADGPGKIIGYRPGGKYIALQGKGASVIIRELERGRASTLAGFVSEEVEPIQVAVFSPKDDYVLTRLWVRKAERYREALWRIADSQKVAEIEISEKALLRWFSPDGKFYNAVDKSGNIRTIDLRTGQTVSNKVGTQRSEDACRLKEKKPSASAAEQAEAGEFEAAVLSENRNFLAISTPTFVEVWDMSESRAAKNIVGRVFGTGRIPRVWRGLSISNNGRWLTMFGESERTIDIWDAKDNRVRSVNNVDVVTGTYFNPNASSLITTSEYSLRVWDLQTGLEKYRAVDDSEIADLSFGPDGSSIATLNEEGLVRVWEMTSDENSVRKLINFDDRSADMTHDGKYLVTLDHETQMAHVWDLRTGQIIATRKFGQVSNHVAFSPGGDEIAVVTSDGDEHTIWLWTWKNPDAGVSREATFTTKKIVGISVSQGGKYLSVLADNSEPLVRVWAASATGGAARDTWELGIKGARLISFMQHTDRMVVTSKQGTQLWDIAHNRPVGDLIGRSSDEKGADLVFIYSYDEGYIANYSRDTKSVEIAETATGTIVGRLHDAKGLKAFDISHNGDLAATAGEDGILRVWAWKGQPHVISEVRYPAEFTTFSRNGKYLATTKDGDSTRVWDISRPGQIKEVARIQRGTGARAAFFSRDDEYLSILESSTMVSVWRWQADELVCEATNRLIKKDLSLEDWVEKYVLPNERYFLDTLHRPVICGVAASTARQ